MKITLENLIEKRDQETKEKKIYKSKILGGEIELERIPRNKVFAIMDEMDEAGGGREQDFIANCRLIYECCPIFRAPEFTNGFAEPYDAVIKLFDKHMAEASKIAGEILKFYMGEEEKK